MSRRRLANELQHFDADSLREIILNAYSINEPIKRYFDFFMNPDVPKLLEKQLQQARKELSRTKWGQCKARITVLRKLIKDFAGYDPGAEHVAELYYRIVTMALTAERVFTCGATLTAGIISLVISMVRYCDDNRCADIAIPMLDTLLSPDGPASDGMRQMLQRAVDEYSCSR